MDYPKTDDDWEKLAECIVTKHTGVFPETVGKLTVEATATIFAWYKGQERSSALTDRQYARGRLVRLAKEAGCLEEHEEIKMSGKMMEVPLGGEERHYWEVTNMVTGEVLQDGVPYRTISEASLDAKRTMNALYSYFEDNHLVIKIFDKSPDERVGLTFEPEYTESYWREGPARQAQEVLGRVSQPLTLDRLLPQTYGDWVNLAEDIKSADPEAWTAGWVNTALQHISEEDEAAEGSKRKLTQRAGELGIR